MKSTTRVLALALAAGLSVTAFAGPTSGEMKTTAATASTKNIVETAVAAGNFNTLAKLLTQADLVTALQGKGPFTVFAPTDQAFEALGTETLNTLLKPENKGKLASILRYHVVSGNVLAKDVKTMAVPTLNGQRFNIVAADGKVKVDNANVTKTDIITSNGVIHVIDAVILPNEREIIATAVGEKLTTFAKLVGLAGLDKALMADGDFTVFAPSDEAFAKLDKATLETLTKPENKAQLAQILTYHVVPKARIFSDAAGAKAKEIGTIAGPALTVALTNGAVTINNAKVTKADIDATNGVIHVIDSVLLPPAGATKSNQPVGQ
ncbi:MAG: fasciclin domain-containing protein [Planctomycetota bacterium]|nr:fasciclin domain-containing protein [Planctomycetota bacterium]